jgi:hypothetical protein
VLKRRLKEALGGFQDGTQLAQNSCRGTLLAHIRADWSFLLSFVFNDLIHNNPVSPYPKLPCAGRRRFRPGGSVLVGRRRARE